MMRALVAVAILLASLVLLAQLSRAAGPDRTSRPSDAAYLQAQRDSVLIEQERMRLERERWDQLARQQVQAQQVQAMQPAPASSTSILTVCISLGLGGLVVAAVVVAFSLARRPQLDERTLLALLAQPRALLPGPVSCAQCGQTMPADARFCSSCGATAGATVTLRSEVR